jgi:hypothetical protein
MMAMTIAVVQPERVGRWLRTPSTVRLRIHGFDTESIVMAMLGGETNELAHLQP